MNQAGTDFARYTHRQLHAMLYAGDPRTLRAAAEQWDAVGARLHEQAGSLERRLTDFQHKWRGGAANQYKVMIMDLYSGLRKLGDNAFAMRNLAHDSADALAKAQATMPKPLDVPELAPGTVHFATTPLQIDPAAPPEAVFRLQRQQAEATAAVRAHQQAAQASNTAHAQAIIVMNELANRYDTANNAVPPKQRQDLLFGSMFTAGLGTATAAAAGQFSGLMPRIPTWAQPGNEDPLPPAPPAGMDQAVPPIPEIGAPGDLGGGDLGGGDLGSGGIGGGGIGGIGGGTPPPVPTAHAGLVAGAAAAGIAAGAIGTSAGPAAGAMTGGGMPMMPMMPMHPMNGGESANARRVPPWLVETEDVWGESSAITPSVIGEDPI